MCSLHLLSQAVDLHFALPQPTITVTGKHPPPGLCRHRRDVNGAVQRALQQDQEQESEQHVQC